MTLIQTKQSMNILLTGATGFLGQHLAFKIDSFSNFNLVSVVRSNTPSVPGKSIFVGEIDGNTDWQSVLIDKDLIIHTAARVHVMKDKVSDSLKNIAKLM